MKIEIRLHFNIDEDEIDYKGQKLLDVVREGLEEVLVDEGIDGDVVEVKFIEEEQQ